VKRKTKTGGDDGCTNTKYESGYGLIGLLY